MWISLAGAGRLGLLLLLLLALDEARNEVLLLKLEGLELALNVHLLGHQLLARLLVQSTLALSETRGSRRAEGCNGRRLGSRSSQSLVGTGVANSSELLELNLLGDEGLLLGVGESSKLCLSLSDLLLLNSLMGKREATLRASEASTSLPTEARHRPDRAGTAGTVGQASHEIKVGGSGSNESLILDVADRTESARLESPGVGVQDRAAGLA